MFGLVSKWLKQKKQIKLFYYLQVRKNPCKNSLVRRVLLFCRNFPRNLLESAQIVFSCSFRISLRQKKKGFCVDGHEMAINRKVLHNVNSTPAQKIKMINRKSPNIFVSSLRSLFIALTIYARIVFISTVLPIADISHQLKTICNTTKYTPYLREINEEK